MSNSFYNTIEKITTQVFSINKDFALKHVVRVSHKAPDGKKELFHSEYTYMSQSSYTNAKYLKSIKLNFNSYLTIEEISKEKSWQDKESIFITSTNIFKFTKALKKARKWLYKYKDLYYYEDKDLLINKEVAKGLNIQLNLNGKIIVIQPTIIVKDDMELEGIVIYINKISCPCKITVDKLDALYHILKRFDLYLAGLSIINYVGRPDSELYNKDIGIESKNDINKFYKEHSTSKGMEALKNSMNRPKGAEFSYFK